MVGFVYPMKWIPAFAGMEIVRMPSGSYIN
jgi:hypothetical protein